jgi:lysophospholipase
MPDPRDITRPHTCTYPDGWRFSEGQMADGWPLRRYDWPQAEGAARRGLILFFTGRGDMPEKYLETLRHWHAQGWSIAGFDWRGQGGSGRLLVDPHIGHIESFAQWLDDLDAFHSAMRREETGPIVAIGHSMGGHLLMRALVDRRIAPDAMVLSAPMLGFDTGRLPIGTVAALVRWAARRWGTRRAWPANEKPSVLASRSAMLTHDAERYADERWWQEQRPDLVLGPPSLNWLAEAYASCQAIEAGQLDRIDTPLLILGTEGDRLVSPAAIQRVAARLPRATLVMTGRNVAHEMLREVDAVRTPLLHQIDAFLSDVKRTG